MAFPVRKLEEKTIEEYKKRGVIAKIKEKNKDGNKFFFLDGPPFVTNEIHQGTLYGYFIKDAIIRYRILKGDNVRLEAGWDTQGLPIEVKVQEKFKLNTKKQIEEIGVDKFIRACREFVDELIEKNDKIFVDSGILLHLAGEYKTYEKRFISGIWSVIKAAYDQNLLIRGKKPTWFCPHCETPMANYEVKDKYEEREDPSLFFLLKLKDREEFLLVWTTTPWTIPSNVAVAVDPEEEYEVVEVNNRKVILAKKRENVLNKAGAYEVKRVFKGKELLGLRYEHPFADLPQISKVLDKIAIVVDGSKYKGEEEEPFVNMNEGSGLVHVAPGHGISDYALSLNFNLPLLSPVNSQGVYTEEAGWLNGKSVWEGNREVINYLKEKGLVFYEGKIKHKYPICWRCKTPLITISTDQWFLLVTKIKDKLIESAKQVNWVPEVAKEMMISWLRNLNDWVISRQRYWGAPLPIWICATCGNIKVIGSAEELENLIGKKLDDLHKDVVDKIELRCEKCGGTMKRVSDVLDVWIDSGSASFATLGGVHTKDFEYWYPADFITEGHDQIRGWFYSLLALGLISTGKAPYKNVLMHRFVVGEDGQKLSKSLGNYIPMDEFYAKGYSADALRWSFLSKNIGDQTVFSTKSVEDATKELLILINLNNLYKEAKNLPFEKPKRLYNKWILHHWNKTKQEVYTALDNFRIDTALNILRKFLIEDLSQTFVKLMKEDLFYLNDKESASVFAKIYKELLIVSNIFAPLISDYLYLNEHNDFAILQTLPNIESDYISEAVEEEMNLTLKLISRILSARSMLQLPIRRPIQAVLLPTSVNEEQAEIIKRLTNVKLLDQFNTTEIKLIYEKAKERLDNKSIEEIVTKISTGKEVSEILDMPEIFEAKREGYQYISGVLLDTSINEDLEREWIQREIIRNVQDKRKEMKLNRGDVIKLEIKGIDEQMKKKILEATNAVQGQGKEKERWKINVNNKEFEIIIYD
jgi:isoleucyl-tRNA synthetase